MKILTINVVGIPSGSSSNLVNANVFQDYDAVVVNPANLDELFGHNRNMYINAEKRILASEYGDILSNIGEKRRDEVNGLLKMGGIVVCFMQPLRTSTYEYIYQGKKSKTQLTNYDWLLTELQMDRELGGIEYGTGSSIEVVDSGHPFSEYLNTKPSWSAYVDKDACENWKVIASAFDTHAVALSKRVGLGHIILLPSDYDYHNSELLERCIIRLLGDKETTPQPSWAQAILVPSQEEFITKITQINEQISALEKERETLTDSEAKLEHWKYLLYEKGKHKLEPVVREALALIGCNIEPQPDKDSDGLITCDYGNALLEIVGSKETIKIEKLGELIKNMGNFMSENESPVKGILVGNPFCEESLNNRPPKNSQKKLFANELIESANKQNIAVLLTTDLYEIVCKILSSEFIEENKRSLRERIFSGKGLVRLV